MTGPGRAARGLCGVCRHGRTVTSDRGSEFLFCEMSRVDDRFRRYPGLPVMTCDGFSVVRTRFAPSPTGSLHLGNARAAALNWLFARNQRGAFVLRIDDTDQERNVPSGEADIIEALQWLGLDHDEGPDRGGAFGPYRQSERIERHRELARQLLESGHAFLCYCTREELHAHRAAAIAADQPPGHSPHRDLSDERRRRFEAEGRSPAIRLRAPGGPIEYRDRLKGVLSIDGDDLGDPTILRADGTPTYNFASTADDIDMRISHVIRGVGHLPNTPKQVLICRALGAQPPEFVHVPTVLAPGGGKLSKRRGAASVLDYRDRGFHPAGVLNYLSLLSWSAADGTEVMAPGELIAGIDLDRLGAHDPELDENKLGWLSGQHIRQEAPEALAAMWRGFGGLDDLGLDGDDLLRAAEVFARRTRLLTEAGPELEAVFGARSAGCPDSAGEGEVLQLVADAWAEAPWRPAELKQAMRTAMKASPVRGRGFFGPLRRALTGRDEGPDLAEVAYALGRGRTLRRLTGKRR